MSSFPLDICYFSALYQGRIYLCEKSIRINIFAALRSKRINDSFYIVRTIAINPQLFDYGAKNHMHNSEMEIICNNFFLYAYLYAMWFSISFLISLTRSDLFYFDTTKSACSFHVLWPLFVLFFELFFNFVFLSVYFIGRSLLSFTGKYINIKFKSTTRALHCCLFMLGFQWCDNTICFLYTRLSLALLTYVEQHEWHFLLLL